MSMFNPVDSGQETLILAEAEKKSRSKGPDFSIRTVTHWHTLKHHLTFCTVPSHYENVPEHDMNGQPYDRYPSRMCVAIDGYEVCRWCFMAQGDVAAIADGHPPVPRSEVNSATSD